MFVFSQCEFEKQRNATRSSRKQYFLKRTQKAVP